MPIHLLPEAVAVRIAAGEVVERPASVVKELVENSLDAGATRLEIETQEGGLRLIRVRDNGHGIPADEVELAFRRHATSKITTAEDLDHIATLGFRGEALASIAAVARVTCTTRHRDADSGVRVRLEGGELIARTPIGYPVGTEMRIEDLFYNVPARRKFLAGARSERKHCDAFLTRYAIAYPHIAFTVIHDGRTFLNTPGHGRADEALMQVYGLDTARKLLPIIPQAGPDGLVRVRGYVGDTSTHRADRGYITLFVNGRWIHDLRLSYAVIQAYHTLLPVNRYPVAFIMLDLPPEDVDVNVHPAKTEIRLRDPDAVFRMILHAVRATVLDLAPVATPWADTPERSALRAQLASLTPARPVFSGDEEGRNTPEAPTLWDTPATAAPNEQRRLSSLLAGLPQPPIGAAADAATQGPVSPAEGAGETRPRVEGVPHAPTEAEGPALPRVEGVPHAPTEDESPVWPRVEGVPHAPTEAVGPAWPRVEGVPHAPTEAEGPAWPRVEGVPHAPTEAEGPVWPRVEGVPHAPTEAVGPAWPRVEGVPHAPTEAEGPAWRMPGLSTEEETARQETGGGAAPIAGAAWGPWPEIAPSAARAPLPPEKNLPPLRVLGQAAATYIVAEGPDGLYLIDQHAAHERILYEALLEGWLHGHNEAQALLQPVPVTLPVEAAATLETLLPYLPALGFEVELFGTQTFLVRAVPALFQHVPPAELLADLTADEERPAAVLQARQEELLARQICKRAAVKAGQVLSVSEMEALLAALERTQSPRTCPHGRPTLIHLPLDQLARQFWRT